MATKRAKSTEGEEFLTVDDVAGRLKLPPASIYRLVSAGKIPHYRFHKKAIRFKSEELDRWYAANRRAGR